MERNNYDSSQNVIEFNNSDIDEKLDNLEELDDVVEQFSQENPTIESSYKERVTFAPTSLTFGEYLTPDVIAPIIDDDDNMQYNNLKKRYDMGIPSNVEGVDPTEIEKAKSSKLSIKLQVDAITQAFENLLNDKMKSSNRITEKITISPSSDDAYIGNTINAFAYVFSKLAKNHRSSTKYHFLNIHIPFDKQSNGYNLKKAKGEILEKPLSRLVYDLSVKHLLKTIITKNNTNEFIRFNDTTKRWEEINEKTALSFVKNKIDNLLGQIGLEEFSSSLSAKNARDSIIQKITNQSSSEKAMLYRFTIDNPRYVQFKDTIYNMEEHSIAKATQYFKLSNYHNYRLPMGSLTIDKLDEVVAEHELTINDFLNTNEHLNNHDDLGKFFVSLDDYGVTKQSVKEQAQLLIDRFEYTTQGYMFLINFIGSLFDHEANLLTFPILSGGGGLGKSMLLSSIVVDRIIGSENNSSLDQSRLEKANQFTSSALFEKEINSISEMKGSYFSNDFIKLIKSSGEDKQEIEFKNSNSFSASLYARFIGVSNKDQVPKIKSSEIDDEGIRRRIAIIHCRDFNSITGESKDEFSNIKKVNMEERFPKDEMLSDESIGAFALYAMMTYEENRQNGAIQKFSRNGGASKQVVEGLTNQKIVSDTKDYFNKNDRFRQIAFILADAYVSDMNEDDNIYRYCLTEQPPKQYDTLQDWLTVLKTSTVKDIYNVWYSNNFESRQNKSAIVEYLENENNMSKVQTSDDNYVTSTGTGKKRVRSYGRTFAYFIINILLEDGSIKYFKILNDGTYEIVAKNDEKHIVDENGTLFLDDTEIISRDFVQHLEIEKAK